MAISKGRWVRVVLTKDTARLTADWLLQAYTPAPPRTLLDNDSFEYRQKQLNMAWKLGNQLKKAAERAAHWPREVRILRKEAEWFSFAVAGNYNHFARAFRGSIDWGIVSAAELSPAGRAISEIGSVIRVATYKKRGRPRKRLEDLSQNDEREVRRRRSEARNLAKLIAEFDGKTLAG